ncbi:protein mono-ADP-ribosyltransferase PARP12-like isoform X2 [Polypterus senegalus]|uniref:protein mono-ADP-ribosyltransferase PARP12-like isoform X2 n=1 Tax=Polypterus senegalus TaxID=55291 RepID=UPI001965B834|nr:protein mono-ADP-ribosyltransferase PARP12-like isoform X2 [Polypterus senegalus]
MFQPAATFLTMSVSSLISYATKLICSNGGSMDYRELHRLVTHYFNDSDNVLLKVLRNKTRFVVAHGKKEQASGDRLSPTCKIFAKTSLRMCKVYPNGSCDNCRALHLCKYFVYQNCLYDNGRCRNSHDLNSDHNSPLLRYHHLQDLEQTELFQLLMQNDVSLLPEQTQQFGDEDGILFTTNPAPFLALPVDPPPCSMEGLKAKF